MIRQIIVASLGLIGLISLLIFIEVKIAPKYANAWTDEQNEERSRRPIYEVYKDGHFVDACSSTQYFIRNMAREHGYCERIIFGMIVMESTFDPRTVNTVGNWRGLAQISPFWLRAKLVEPFRLTEDHAQRDLRDPFHNILTLIEIWNYARYTYDIDSSTELGMRQLLFWHSTGDFRINPKTPYISTVLRYVDELVCMKETEIFIDFHSVSLYNIITLK